MNINKNKKSNNILFKDYKTNDNNKVFMNKLFNETNKLVNNSVKKTITNDTISKELFDEIIQIEREIENFEYLDESFEFKLKLKEYLLVNCPFIKDKVDDIFYA